MLTKAENASDEELVILFADKLSNLRSFKNELLEEGETFWNRFHGSKEEQNWFNTELFNIFQKRINKNDRQQKFLQEFQEHIRFLWN